ncbi:DUF6979 family protein [Edwardsiella tarda]|uniref:DUF6979 family protein n=1 Tax=Edwardsiella tarda TaxID=636 RepID=UPI003D2ED872
MKAPSASCYGSIAWNAYCLARDGMPPVQAWNETAKGKKEVCPRIAFLGLCEDGFLQHIPAGVYLNSRNLKNALYATSAANHLLAHPNMAHSITPNSLWAIALEEAGEAPCKAYHQQMHIVLTLWGEGVIQSPQR